MQIWCGLYPELPAPVSVCTCDAKIWLSRIDFEHFLRKENFILWHPVREVPLAV
jgi:hypothetical protein